MMLASEIGIALVSAGGLWLLLMMMFRASGQASYFFSGTRRNVEDHDEK